MYPSKSAYHFYECVACTIHVTDINVYRKAQESNTNVTDGYEEALVLLEQVGPLWVSTHTHTHLKIEKMTLSDSDAWKW